MKSMCGGMGVNPRRPDWGESWTGSRWMRLPDLITSGHLDRSANAYKYCRGIKSTLPSSLSSSSSSSATPLSSLSLSLGRAISCFPLSSMEFDHAPKTAPASYLDAGDAGFSYLDSDYIRYPTPGLDAMDLPPTSPTSGFHELHNGLGLNHTLNEVYYQPSSPSSSGTAPGPFGSPTEAFTALDSIAPPSLVGPSYQLESAAHRRRGSGSLSPPIHSPSAIPRSLANAGHAHVQQAATSASVAAGRRYNPIARPPRRKAAARRSIDDESDDEDDDFAPSAANTSGGPDTRRETIRRQRIESEQRRRDELRDGYARLKETLPPTNQKSSKVSLLDRATNHVRNLEVAKSELEKRLQEAETQVKHLRHINEVLSVRAVQTRARPCRVSFCQHSLAIHLERENTQTNHEMADIPALRRQLKIKAGATSRLKKEHDMYLKEVDDLKIKKDKLVADGADEWDVKNATRMLEESQKMITDTEGRLAKAYDDLRDAVVAAKKEPELATDEEYLKAEGVLEEAAL
uniref:BHLH domain-containing protein n=1 Tax=Mycena chlorophos TaxID=658473 RepID=A0ABQ0MDD6_MYCCL|nr:predicted protein [Mycena chlorophos]